jgi:uncharacterized protein with HEPN domain
VSDEHERRYLAWIKESIERVYAYSRDHPGALLEDGAIRDAIVWRLETIGEATSHPSDALKARHPSLPWHEMRGFRNIAAHGYLTVKASRVREIVEHDVPALLAVVEQELSASS